MILGDPDLRLYTTHMVDEGGPEGRKDLASGHDVDPYFAPERRQPHTPLATGSCPRDLRCQDPPTRRGATRLGTENRQGSS